LGLSVEADVLPDMRALLLDSLAENRNMPLQFFFHRSDMNSAHEFDALARLIRMHPQLDSLEQETLDFNNMIFGALSNNELPLEVKRARLKAIRAIVENREWKVLRLLWPTTLSCAELRPILHELSLGRSVVTELLSLVVRRSESGCAKEIVNAFTKAGKIETLSFIGVDFPDHERQQIDTVFAEKKQQDQLGEYSHFQFDKNYPRVN
jgi:hypothetical protein